MIILIALITTLFLHTNTYEKATVVIEVNNNIISCVDENEEVYEFEEENGYKWSVGDECLLIMDDNGTQDEKDDIIIETYS